MGKGLMSGSYACYLMARGNGPDESESDEQGGQRGQGQADGQGTGGHGAGGQGRSGGQGQSGGPGQGQSGGPGQGQSGGSGQAGGQGQNRRQGQTGGQGQNREQGQGGYDQGQGGGQNPGGQPAGQGAPQGGHGQAGGRGQTGGQGSAAGGRPAQGQAGGQPHGGQAAPQGGAVSGAGPGGYQQPAAQGESIADIFSKPRTLAQIKSAVAYYAAVGVGVGVSLLFTALIFGGGGFAGNMITAIVAFAGFVAAVAIGPALGGPLGFYVADQLGDEEKAEHVYATASVGALGGHIVMVLVVAVFLMIGLAGGGGGAGFEFLRALIPIVIGGFGAAIAAAGGAFASLTFTGESGASPGGVPPQNQPR